MKKKYHRVGFSAAQSAELWDRWRKGQCLSAIGREFGKPSSSIFAHVRPTGGITPTPRRRSRLALTMAEREEISRGLVAGQSIRAIAAGLSRCASTISREIRRNGGSWRYRAAAADKRAWKQAKRAKPCKLVRNGCLRQAVVLMAILYDPEDLGDIRVDSPLSLYVLPLGFTLIGGVVFVAFALSGCRALRRAGAAAENRGDHAHRPAQSQGAAPWTMPQNTAQTETGGDRDDSPGRPRQGRKREPREPTVRR